MKPVKTHQLNDSVPYEYATALLVGPKNKLSNKARKRFRAARARVIETHGQPVHQVGRRDYPLYVIDPEFKRKSGEAKMTAKLAQKSLTQLRNIMHRATTHRRSLQREYERLQSRECPAGANEKNKKIFALKKAQGLQLLNLAADALDLRLEFALLEVQKRVAKAAAL